MPLAKRWQPFDRETIARTPERYGVYELGDENGEVVTVGSGVLRRELKSELAYTDAKRVRWEETQTADRAEELAAEHEERL